MNKTKETMLESIFLGCRNANDFYNELCAGCMKKHGETLDEFLAFYVLKLKGTIQDDVAYFMCPICFHDIMQSIKTGDRKDCKVVLISDIEKAIENRGLR